MSASFKDLKGRELRCVITVATMKELKDSLQVDIGNISDGKLFDQLSLDDELLVNVIGVVCKDSIAAQGITEALDLAESLGGDTLDAANDAFWEAVADFTRPRKRGLLRDLITRSKEAESAAVNRASVQLASLNMEAIMTQAMDGQKVESTSGVGG